MNNLDENWFAPENGSLQPTSYAREAAPKRIETNIQPKLISSSLSPVSESIWRKVEKSYSAKNQTIDKIHVMNEIGRFSYYTDGLDTLKALEANFDELHRKGCMFPDMMKIACHRVGKNNIERFLGLSFAFESVFSFQDRIKLIGRPTGDSIVRTVAIHYAELMNQHDISVEDIVEIAANKDGVRQIEGLVNLLNAIKDFPGYSECITTIIEKFKVHGMGKRVTELLNCRPNQSQFQSAQAYVNHVFRVTDQFSNDPVLLSGGHKRTSAEQTISAELKLQKF